MLPVMTDREKVRIGERFSVSFQRTLRIPDDGQVYPLPPGLGSFPIHRAEDYPDRVPATWQGHNNLFIPMYQREALWLWFDGSYWKPNAVKIAVGKINAVSGEPWEDKLHDAPQDYLVCPDQPWLDGINVSQGVIRQFVAMPLGRGYTIEAQTTGTEEFGGIQIQVYEPKPGQFPDHPPVESSLGPQVLASLAPAAETEMGLGAGGKMKQKIYPDPYGIATWDPTNYGCVFIHIVNSEQYRDITGCEPPLTPVSTETYTKHGFPWFDLYDEARGDVAASERLAQVKTIHEIDTEKGMVSGEGDASVEVPESHIITLRGRDETNDQEA